MSLKSDKIFTAFGEESAQNEVQICDWPGCQDEGEHRAPKSRERIREYHWFCLEHVRIYNRSWNYYEGMSDEQVDKIVRSDTTWNRPTWPLGDPRKGASDDRAEFAFGPENMGPGYENLGDPFGFFSEEMANSTTADRAPKKSLSASERKALSTLDLDVSVTVAELKARYKLLVKKYHPDVTGGDKKSEERFKQINEAYEVLKQSLEVD